MQITSSDIVQLGPKLGALSPNQAGLQPADFLQLANLITMVMTSELYAAREEYLIYQEAIPVVANQSRYRVPSRALNGNLRHLWYEDSAGTRSKLWVRSHEDLEYYNATQTGPPSAFMLQGNDIVLLPIPQNAGSLVVAYPFRPNLLVDVTTTQTILTVATKSVTVANVPANFISGVKYDIIDNASGGGIVHYDLDGTVNTSTRTITFAQSIPNAKPGHWIAQAGQTPVPNLPEEGQPLLLETVVLRLEMLRGNAARIKNSSAVVQDARKAWDALLLSRVLSKPIPTGNGGPFFPVRPY